MSIFFIEKLPVSTLTHHTNVKILLVKKWTEVSFVFVNENIFKTQQTEASHSRAAATQLSLIISNLHVLNNEVIS